MRKKLIALSLSFLFLGSMATTSVAMTLQVTNQTTIVNKDDDKDKNKKKAKTSDSKKAKECKTEKSCCGKTEMYEKSCKSDSKKGGDKK
ncbi:MAG: hypothetical protein L3J66_00250 [Bacteroidales bacterium]|nr:hypothetical protein [Bacteroidales bacterium]